MRRYTEEEIIYDKLFVANLTIYNIAVINLNLVANFKVFHKPTIINLDWVSPVSMQTRYYSTISASTIHIIFKGKLVHT